MYEEIKKNFNYIRVEKIRKMYTGDKIQKEERDSQKNYKDELQYKVYYAGQIVLEIDDEVKIPSAKFGISGKKKLQEDNYNSFEEYKEFKKPLLKEEYTNKIQCKAENILIRYSKKHEPNQENYEQLLNVLKKYEKYLEKGYKEKLEKSYNTYTETQIQIEENMRFIRGVPSF